MHAAICARVLRCASAELAVSPFLLLAALLPPAGGGRHAIGAGAAAGGCGLCLVAAGQEVGKHTLLMLEAEWYPLGSVCYSVLLAARYTQ